MLTKVRVWIFIGLGFVGFYYGARERLIDSLGPDSSFSKVLASELIGLILLGLFMFFFFFEELLRPLLAWLRRTKSQLIVHSTAEFISYVPSSKTDSMIKKTDEFSRSVLRQDYEEAALNPQRSLGVAKRCNNSVWRVYSRKKRRFNTSTDLQGFCLVGYPNKELTNAITAGEVETGHDISASLLEAGPDAGSAVYIFGLYAKSSRFQTILTARVSQELRLLFQKNENLQYCFAKAGTKNGDALLQRFGFEPIEGSRIRKLEREKLLLVTNKMENVLHRVLD